MIVENISVIHRYLQFPTCPVSSAIYIPLVTSTAENTIHRNFYFNLTSGFDLAAINAQRVQIAFVGYYGRE